MGNVRIFEQDGGGAAHHFVGAHHRRTGRQAINGDDVALVLLRNEASRCAVECRPGQRDQARIDHHHDQGETHQAPRHRAIAASKLRKYRVKAACKQRERQHQRGCKLAALGARIVSPQQQGAQRRRQGQGHDRRDDGRAGDGQRELAIELARDARNKSGRHEHRHQHQRDGDQRTTHFVHGFVRRLARRHALAQIALDVLHHHDRIVDRDADRQHQPEQSQIVDREAKGLHHCEGADQRYRNGNDGNDRSAPGLQEHHDHQHHQQHRFKDREVDLVHRVGDELGGIESDHIGDTRRQLFTDLGHQRFDRARGLNSVRTGPLKDWHR